MLIIQGAWFDVYENDNPEKITTYSNMDTFEFSVSKSMLEDKLSQQ